MTPLRRIESPVIPLLEDRVDTDVIYPARFLLLMQRDGLADTLFRDRRFTIDDRPIPGSPFDDPALAGAQVLLAGEDFGCGSSREQAVWALYDFGIRCVIARSFGEIFAANALRNGMLTLALPADAIARITEAGRIAIELEARTLRAGGFEAVIDIPEASRERLLGGWDEIDMIQREGAAIAEYETRQRRTQPWLYG
jgi:3-isopropylmalate/(R)-2-methylmalate dehydratase small subunit